MLRLTEDAAFKRRVMQETGTHTPTMIGEWHATVGQGVRCLADLWHRKCSCLRIMTAAMSRLGIWCERGQCT